MNHLWGLVWVDNGHGILVITLGVAVIVGVVLVVGLNQDGKTLCAEDVGVTIFKSVPA